MKLLCFIIVQRCLVTLHVVERYPSFFFIMCLFYSVGGGIRVLHQFLSLLPLSRSFLHFLDCLSFIRTYFSNLYCQFSSSASSLFFVVDFSNSITFFVIPSCSYHAIKPIQLLLFSAVASCFIIRVMSSFFILFSQLSFRAIPYPLSIFYFHPCFVESNVQMRGYLFVLLSYYYSSFSVVFHKFWFTHLRKIQFTFLK